MLIYSQTMSTFLLIKPCMSYTFHLYLLRSIWTHPCYSPTPTLCSKVLLRRRIKMQRIFPRSIRSAWHTEPPVSHPWEDWSPRRCLAPVPRTLIVVSVYIIMLFRFVTLFSDISILMLYVWTSWAHMMRTWHLRIWTMIIRCARSYICIVALVIIHLVPQLHVTIWL